MRYRAHVVASILTVVAMAAIAAVALHRLPGDAMLSTHWGMDGRPDRYASARVALLLPIALAAFVSSVMAVLPLIEPMRDRLAASAPLYRTAWGGVLAITAWVELMVAGPAFGRDLSGSSMLAATGLLLIVLGNALPKSRPNHLVGIRTPWTLTDPDNWIATHRHGARIMIAGGAALIACATAPVDAGARALLTGAIILVVATLPVVYSFFFSRWKRRS